MSSSQHTVSSSTSAAGRNALTNDKKRRFILDLIAPAKVVPLENTAVAQPGAAVPVKAIEDRGIHIDSSMSENRD